MRTEEVEAHIEDFKESLAYWSQKLAGYESGARELKSVKGGPFIDCTDERRAFAEWMMSVSADRIAYWQGFM